MSETIFVTDRPINPDACIAQEGLYSYRTPFGFIQIGDEVVYVKAGEDSVQRPDGKWETRVYRETCTKLHKYLGRMVADE